MEKIKQERYYGIDLLKVISMYMVVLMHVLRQGGILNACEIGSHRYWAAWLLQIAAYPAVNCFAMASGFLMVDRPFKYRKIIPLWVTVFFYTVIIMVIGDYFFPEAVSFKHKFYLLPALSSEYWYFTAYFCMFFFIPFLNVLINALSKKQMYTLLLTGFLLFSASRIITYLTPDCFKLDNGYTVWWLIYLYLLGAGIKKYNMFHKLTAITALTGYVCMTMLTLLTKVLTLHLQNDVEWENPNAPVFISMLGVDRFVSYLSPTIVVSAVFLMMLCLKIRIPEVFRNILKKLSPLVFQVYIIHTHFIVWNYFMKDRFVDYAAVKSTIYMLLLAIVTAAAIFIVCIFIDMLRACLFKLLKVNSSINKLADYVNKVVKHEAGKTDNKINV